MTPIKYTEINLFLKQANVKLKRIQRDKTVDSSMVMNLRLFLVGIAKLLQYFKNVTPSDGANASITYQFFTVRFWEDISNTKARILKPVLNRRRYAEFSNMFTALKDLNKNASTETAPIFVLLLTVFLVEMYALLMLSSTAIVDPTALEGSSAKTTVREMLAFRRKLTTPLNLYNAIKDASSGFLGVDYFIKEVMVILDDMQPFLGKSLRNLISYNNKLV